MELRALHLQTPDPERLQAFYGTTLGLPVAMDSDGNLNVDAGFSTIKWSKGDAAYYHFAFNVPHDLVAASGEWLEARGLTLLPFEGERLVDFPNWDAHSVYFHDPVGNILEFIGRRRLGLAGKADFAVGDIWSVSEMGVAVHDFAALRWMLSGGAEAGWEGLPVFGTPSEYFTAFGDDHGLLITVDANVKRWIPVMEPALPFPFRVEAMHAGQVFSLWMEAGQMGLSLE